MVIILKKLLTFRPRHYPEAFLLIGRALSINLYVRPRENDQIYLTARIKPRHVRFGGGSASPVYIDLYTLVCITHVI